MSNITQVVNKPALYVNGLQLTVASNTTIGMATGQARDATNNFDITISTALTIDTSVVGLNGIDTGTLAASTWYAVYVIQDATGFNRSGGLISTSFTSPVLPFGYTDFILVGFQLTDGSTHFLPNTTVGNSKTRHLVWTNGISVLSGGSQNGSYAAIDLSSAVPGIDNCMVDLNVQFTPATASDYTQFRPSGVTGATTNLDKVYGSVASKVNSDNFSTLSKLVSGLAKIDYQNSAASGATTVIVRGFTYYI